MDLTWSVIANGYSKVCLKVATGDSAFSIFRRDPVFTQVMEFHYQQDGERYLNVIKRDNPKLIKYFNRFKTSEDFARLGKVTFTDKEPNTHLTNFMMYWNGK
uniref:Uncharacterized protein n=1 Tax=viral metagenome TaxID=1070528 RepID=A0A6M3XKK5_9ZZZZ